MADSVNTTAEGEEWSTIIRPNTGWLDLHLGELWRYRDLVLLFVRRDFVAEYKQTILGPAWHVINPLITTVVFTVIFGRVAQISTDGLPPFLFYLAGTVSWNYFSRSLTKTSSTFVANAAMFRKVYFPRLSVPVSITMSNLVSFGIQFLIFLGFIAWYMSTGAEVAPNRWAMLAPVLLLMLAGLSLGGGIIVSALTTRYRDLNQLVTYGVSILMYVTPVIYPVSTIPERFQPFLVANPLAPIFEAFRYGFLGAGTVRPGQLVYSGVATVVLLVVGLLLFSRVERTFTDTV